MPNGPNVSNQKQAAMHFRVDMTVMLDEPIVVPDPIEPAVGYFITVGVNAPDLAAAVKYAHDFALKPKQADGSVHSFQGVVEDAEVQRIDKTEWGPEIQRESKRIDQEGVYYSTTLVFFAEGEGNSD